MLYNELNLSQIPDEFGFPRHNRNNRDSDIMKYIYMR